MKARRAREGSRHEQLVGHDEAKAAERALATEQCEGQQSQSEQRAPRSAVEPREDIHSQPHGFRALALRNLSWDPQRASTPDLSPISWSWAYNPASWTR
jgi:hypothetical protein